MADGITFFNPDPLTVGDGIIFQNTLGGCVWFDVYNYHEQDTSWDTLNETEQDVAWSIFAEYLYYIQQIHAKTVCFDFATAPGEYLGVPIGQEVSILEPTQFDYQINNQTIFTFYLADTYDVGAEEFDKRN